jgi:hypothetical protein
MHIQMFSASPQDTSPWLAAQRQGRVCRAAMRRLYSAALLLAVARTPADADANAADDSFSTLVTSRTLLKSKLKAALLS